MASPAMKLLTDVSEIEELTRSNVHIRNKEELLRKINKVIQDGSSKLQIVTDFDHTLTRHFTDNGTAVLTSFGMFGQCPSVPQKYKDEDKRLAAIYKPIEADPHMSIEEKTKHMINWYIEGNKLFKGLKFPKAELKEVASKMLDSFRLGVQDLISWSAQQRVPVLVFSAGLGEAVVAALKAAKLLQPHVKVVSNFLAMDASDTITGIGGDVIIHTLNKNETAIKGTEYYEMVRERNNVLLMGDNIGDAGMAEGMEHCDVVIKIGFLGHRGESHLKNYLSKFDIVLVEEHTMDVTNAILKLVL